MVAPSLGGYNHFEQLLTSPSNPLNHTTTSATTIINSTTTYLPAPTTTTTPPTPAGASW